LKKAQLQADAGNEEACMTELNTAKAALGKTPHSRGIGPRPGNLPGPRPFFWYARVLGANRLAERLACAPNGWSDE
jgi:hypothetical protein